MRRLDGGLLRVPTHGTAFEGAAREIAVTADRIEAAVTELRVKFDALLTALSAGEGAS